MPLLAGQVLRTAVEAGSAVVVTQGSVSVRPSPVWLGESMVSGRTVLNEGEAWVSERGGWIEISASGAAQVVALPAVRPAAARPWLPILRWLRIGEARKTKDCPWPDLPPLVPR
ncbi:hypothetical protein [Variovorax jilinensis]|uniref:hypothetical protein n=1 Tax=Variovorax jilinensis TaxID=3053513 RepID=UPI0025759C88|nr:hypothetical protein [Variovorax sp. J22P168]